MSELTRVLYVLDDFPGPFAGTEKQFWRLWSGLDRERFHPSVLVLRPSAYLETHVPPEDYFVAGVGRLASPSSILKILAAMRWVRRRGATVAHIFFNDCSLVMPPFLKYVAGMRVIVSRRDLGIWYTPARLRVLRTVRRCVDRVVANSAAVGEVTAREEGYPADRISVIHNGVDLGACVPLAGAAAERAGFRVVVTANIWPRKGIDIVIRALPAVRKVRPDVQLILIGGDRPGVSGPSHQQELERLAQELGVADHVVFLGPQVNPLSTVVACDVGVLCSESEGLSNAVMEYMQAGLPVVCTPVGGNVELVEHGVTGLHVPPGDVEAIASALVRLATLPELAQSMGRNGRARIVENFSEGRMIAAHQSLYCELAHV